MKSSRSIRIALGGTILILAGIAFLARPDGDELRSLDHFQHTVSFDDDEDGDRTMDYRIFGDRDLIVAAVPGAASVKAEIIQAAIQYDFVLPSGKSARLTFSRNKPGGPHHLLVEVKPSSWSYRVLRRLGLR